MKTKEQIRQYVAARPGIDIRKVCKNLAVPTALAREALGETPAPTPAAPGRAVSDLIAQFDDVAKVEKTMKALPKAQYLEDEEMRRAVSCGSGRWRDVRTHPRLSAYLYRLPNGRHVWMHPSAQANLNSAIQVTSA